MQSVAVFESGLRICSLLIETPTSHYTEQMMCIIDVVNCAGLIHVAASVGLSLLAPRKKISVMLIGNHSAGKSSFINWYTFS